MTETFLIGFTGFQIVVKDGQVKSVFFNILSLSKKPTSDTTILGIRTKYIFNLSSSYFKNKQPSRTLTVL